MFDVIILPFSSQDGFGDDVTIVLDFAAVAFGDEALAPALWHLLQQLLRENALAHANRRKLLQQHERVRHVCTGWGRGEEVDGEKGEESEDREEEEDGRKTSEGEEERRRGEGWRKGDGGEEVDGEKTRTLGEESEDREERGDGKKTRGGRRKRMEEKKGER